MANLRLALELQERHPQARLLIANKHLPGADALGDLLGGITVIESVGIAADDLVATTFGEEVREIRRVDGSNLMLVRCGIDARDTLHDLSVSRLQCGTQSPCWPFDARGQPPGSCSPSWSGL